MSDQHRYLLLPLVQETKEYIDVFTNVGIPFEQIEQSIRDFVYDLVFTDPKNTIKDSDAYYIEHFDLDIISRSLLWEKRSIFHALSVISDF